MKTLMRRSANMGLMGVAVFGSMLAGAIQVLALTQEQIVQKLSPVPVFTIANSQGAPLVASPPQGEKGRPVAGVFISQKDAQAFLDTLKTRNPEVAKDVKVVPVSLAEVYKLNQESQSKPEQLGFAFVPSKQQVDVAMDLLKKGGQDVKQFNGTPIFVARGGAQKGYLTIQDNGKTYIPMFFKREELQVLLDRFKQQQPNQASTLEVQVLNLEGVIEVMRTKNDPQLEQIILIPPQESLEYVRSLAGQQGKPQAAPAQQPKK